MPTENLLTIDGKKFEVLITKLSRNASIADRYDRRVYSGDLERDVIGTYVNYTLEFAYCDEPDKYDILWHKLCEPVKFHTLILPSNTGYTGSFQAYINNVRDTIEYSKPTSSATKGDRIFRNLSCDFVARLPNLSVQ